MDSMHGFSIATLLTHAFLRGRISVCHISWAVFDVSERGVVSVDTAHKEHG